jgi:hypothetical protein
VRKLLPALLVLTFLGAVAGATGIPARQMTAGVPAAPISAPAAAEQGLSLTPEEVIALMALIEQLQGEVAERDEAITKLKLKFTKSTNCV